METKRSAAPEGQTGHFPGAIAAGLREVVALAEPLLRAMSEASAARKQPFDSMSVGFRVALLVHCSRLSIARSKQ